MLMKEAEAEELGRGIRDTEEAIAVSERTKASSLGAWREIARLETSGPVSGDW